MDKAQDIFSINSFLKNYEEVKNINTLNLDIKYNILSIKLKSKASDKDWGIFLLGTESTPPQKYWIPQPLIRYCHDANIDLKNISEFGTIFIKITHVEKIDNDSAKKYLTHFTFGIEPSPPIWITKYLDIISKFNEAYKSNKIKHKEAIQNYVKLCSNINVDGLKGEMKKECKKVCVDLDKHKEYCFKNIFFHSFVKNFTIIKKYLYLSLNIKFYNVFRTIQ